MFSSRGKVWLTIATIVIAATILAGSLSWQFTRSDDKEAPAGGLSFYMEYASERTGTPVNAHGDVLPIVSSGRWWYQAPDKLRYEFDATDPLLGHTQSVTANDGHIATQYDGSTNTYRTTPVTPPGRHPMGSGPLSPTWASMPVGPLGFATVDEAVQRLARGATVTRVGEETLLGRKTDIYVMERIAAPLPDGMPTRTRETYWIESEPLAILKGVAESTDGSHFAVVATRLEYRSSIDDSTFTLKQPTGSQDISGAPLATTSAVGESIVPAPFLTATYLPDGFRWAGSSGSPEISHTQEFRSDGGGYLRVDQRYRHGGWPGNVPVPGTEMPYSAGSVRVLQDASPVVLLGMRGDIIVRIEAEGVSYSQTASVLAGVLFVLR